MIETESANAFTQQFESLGWVLHKIDGSIDYGIDYEVEIFDDGSTTGRTFKVQLKGAERAAPNGPHRDIKIEHLRYWSELAVPVMIVLYIVQDKSLFAKWSHQVDLGPDPRPAKTKRVKFTQADRLALRLPELRGEVEMLRQISTSRLPKPLPLAVDFDPPMSQAQFRSLLRADIADNDLESHIRIVADQTDCVTLTISERQLRAELPLAAGSTNVHYDHSVNGRDHWAGLLADCYAILAHLFASRGSTAEAVALLRAHPGDSAVLSLETFIEELGDAIRAERATDLLVSQIIRLLWSDADNEIEAFDHYYALLHVLCHDLDEHDLEYLANAFDQRITFERERGETRAAARYSFNFGSLLNSTSEWDQVPHYIRQATTIDPNGYGRRPEPYEYLGQAAWHRSQFAESAEHYAKARASGVPLDQIASRLSDALMFSGRYRDSKDVLDELDKQSPLAGRDLLRALSLGEILNYVPDGQQTRRGLTEVQLEDLASGDEEMTRALIGNYDALDPRAWHRLNELQDTHSFDRSVLIAYVAEVPYVRAMAVLEAISIGVDDDLLDALVVDGTFSGKDFATILDTMAEAGENAQFSIQLGAARDRALDYSHPRDLTLNQVDESNQVTEAFKTRLN